MYSHLLTLNLLLGVDLVDRCYLNNIFNFLDLGVLKRRFACLKFLRQEPERACPVIAACIVLHNISISRRVPLPDDEEDDADDQDNNPADNGGAQPNMNGRIARARIVQQHFV